MHQARSIFLLLVIGITLIPWQAICAAHPLGHDHHEHDGPSPCELRRQYKGKESVFWPPMECQHLSSAVDDYSPTQVEKITPTIQMVAVLTVLLDIVTINATHEPFLLPPDPNCRSATLYSDSPLRAPPLV